MNRFITLIAECTTNCQLDDIPWDPAQRPVWYPIDTSDGNPARKPRGEPRALNFRGIPPEEQRGSASSRGIPWHPMGSHGLPWRPSGSYGLPLEAPQATTDPAWAHMVARKMETNGGPMGSHKPKHSSTRSRHAVEHAPWWQRHETATLGLWHPMGKQGHGGHCRFNAWDLLKTVQQRIATAAHERAPL